MNDQIIKRARAAVERFERAPSNEPHADALAAAERSVRDLAIAARAELFPSSVDRVSVDVLMDFESLAGDMSSTISTIVQDLAALHADAYPELAAVIRGRRGHALLERVLAGRVAAPSGELERFEQLIAEQLLLQGISVDVAEVVARTVPQLQARIDAERERRALVAAAAVAAADGERAIAERVLADARRQRLEQLAHRASNVATVRVRFANVDEWTGSMLSLHLQRLGVFDDDAFLTRIEDAIAVAEFEKTVNARSGGRTASA
jgi:hypothetical protein